MRDTNQRHVYLLSKVHALIFSQDRTSFTRLSVFLSALQVNNKIGFFSVPILQHLDIVLLSYGHQSDLRQMYREIKFLFGPVLDVTSNNDLFTYTMAPTHGNIKGREAQTVKVTKPLSESLRGAVRALDEDLAEVCWGQHRRGCIHAPM